MHVIISRTLPTLLDLEINNLDVFHIRSYHSNKGPSSPRSPIYVAALVRHENAAHSEIHAEIQGRTVVTMKRLNPTRAWVVAAYAISICGVWALSFVVPWWGWLLLVVLVSTGLKNAAKLALEVIRGGRTGQRAGGTEAGR